MHYTEKLSEIKTTKMQPSVSAVLLVLTEALLFSVTAQPTNDQRVYSQCGLNRDQQELMQDLHALLTRATKSSLVSDIVVKQICQKGQNETQNEVRKKATLTASSKCQSNYRMRLNVSFRN